MFSRSLFQKEAFEIRFMDSDSWIELTKSSCAEQNLFHEITCIRNEVKLEIRVSWNQIHVMSWDRKLDRDAGSRIDFWTTFPKLNWPNLISERFPDRLVFRFYFIPDLSNQSIALRKKLSRSLIHQSNLKKTISKASFWRRDRENISDSWIQIHKFK